MLEFVGSKLHSFDCLSRFARPPGTNSPFRLPTGTDLHHEETPHGTLPLLRQWVACMFSVHDPPLWPMGPREQQRVSTNIKQHKEQCLTRTCSTQCIHSSRLNAHVSGAWFLKFIQKRPALILRGEHVSDSKPVPLEGSLSVRTQKRSDSLASLTGGSSGYLHYHEVTRYNTDYHRQAMPAGKLGYSASVLQN
jgi:hypothetical protein